MDKSCYRNPSKSEDIGRCGGDEKTEWPRRTDKSRQKNTKKQNCIQFQRLPMLSDIAQQVDITNLLSLLDLLYCSYLRYTTK